MVAMQVARHRSHRAQDLHNSRFKCSLSLSNNHNNMNIAQHQQLQQQTGGDEFLVSPHGAQLHPQYVDAMAAQGQMADLSGLPFDAYMGPKNSNSWTWVWIMALLLAKCA